jgi:hypothetical protein
MFKPFFIHHHHAPGHRPNRAPRGFTALISPHYDESNDQMVCADPRMVTMRVALCSPKDQFVKATGRSQAAIAHAETLNKRDVPRMLHSLSALCEIDSAPWNSEADWYYVLKHLI